MKPLKILHCANFSELKDGAVYYSIDRKLTNGLTRNGHFVYPFSYRDIAKTSRTLFLKSSGTKTMLSRLHSTLQHLNPDLLLLGHSELISADDLYTIRRRFPLLKIAMWWVDWIPNIRRNINKLALLDGFFITTDPQELAHLVEDKSTLARCHYLPNLCDSSIDTYDSSKSSNHRFDICFIGRYDKHRQPLIDYLQRHFGHYKLGIFGQTKSDLVFGEAFYQVLAGSKIAINYSRSNTYRKYSSDRLIQPIANGVLTLSARFPGLEELFPATEVPGFDNLEQLGSLLNQFLQDENLRVSTASAARTRAHSQYEATPVAHEMLVKLFQETTD